MENPIARNFNNFVSHFYKSLNAVITQRQCGEETIVVLLANSYGSLRDRVRDCIKSMPDGHDKRSFLEYSSNHFGPAEVSPTLEYLSSLLPADERMPWTLNEMLARAQLAVLAHHKWLLKSHYDCSSISKMVSDQKTKWHSTGDVNTPWIFMGSEFTLEAKICAFPFEPLYAIYLDGSHVCYVHDWPISWNRQVEVDTSSGLNCTAPRPNIFQQLAEDYVNGQWLNIHPLGELKFEVTGGGGKK